MGTDISSKIKGEKNVFLWIVHHVSLYESNAQQKQLNITSH